MSHRILPLRAMRSALRPSAGSPGVWPAARCTAITSSLARYSTGTAAEGQSPAPTEGEQTIIEKLRSRFAGGKISVQDVSGGCGTFYAVSVAHKDFSGVPTIRQHRMVNEVLAEEIKGMHGIQLKTAPQ